MRYDFYIKKKTTKDKNIFKRINGLHVKVYNKDHTTKRWKFKCLSTYDGVTE